MIEQIKNIHGVDYLYLLCQKVEQPIGSLFLTSISWQNLKKIASAQPRVLVDKDETGTEIYRGIQRHLSTERQLEISNYVKGKLATFPTSIIINIPFEELDIFPVTSTFQIVPNLEKDINNTDAIPTEPLKFDNLYLFILPLKLDVAQIIDGQHRLSGFTNLNESLMFDLPITIFVDQEIEYQAEVFATINGKQTRVTPSLVYDLFGLSSKRSPYKLSNEIIKALNENEDSPLQYCFRILGKSNDYYSGYVTQSTFAKNFIMLICGNYKQAEEDKRLLFEDIDVPIETRFSTKKPVLREYFVKREDEVILKVIMNFFKALKNVFNDEWNKENSVLKKTVGFTALFKVLEDLIEKGKYNKTLKEEFFKQELDVVKAHINLENIQLSSKGVNQLYAQFNTKPLSTL